LIFAVLLQVDAVKVLWMGAANGVERGSDWASLSVDYFYSGNSRGGSV